MGARKKSQNGPKPRPPSFSAPIQDSPVNIKPVVEDDLAYLEMSHANGKDFEPYDPSQRDMYFVVHSIYRDGFERIEGRRGPWQKHDNLAFSVLISSSLSKDVYAKMEFEIPFQYPKLPVKGKLLELKPRTQQLENDINNTLAKPPEQTLDETVITEMIQKTQDLLDREATEHEISTKGMSLEAERAYQEALSRDHARAQREYELRMKEEEEIAKEKNLHAAVDIEKKRRHGVYSTEDVEDLDPGADQDVSEIPIRFKEPIKWYNPQSKKTLTFSAVFGPNVLLQRSDKRVTLVHPVRFGKLMPGTFVLKEIYLPDSLVPQAEMESAMDSIRNTLEDCKTTHHPHIVRMYAYQIEHDVSEKELSEWKISILTEQANESGVQSALMMSGCFKAQKVRLWTEQLLQGMSFLDKLGHPHPAVHLGNMMFWRKKEDEIIIKLADGYGAALRNLVDKARAKNAAADQVPTGWIPPELVAGAEGRSGKTSIWQLGIAVIKMAFAGGLQLEEVHTSVDPLLQRDDLRETFKAFLRAAFQSVPRKRPGPAELLSYQMLKEGTQGFNIPTRENPGEEPFLLKSGELATQSSQWENQFIEAQPLGAGGFGQVYKARYLTDNQLYAVKRLVCVSQGDLDAIWSEVQLLAALNHPGIVRYYNAWQEDEQTDDKILERVIDPQPSVAHSVRNRLLDPSTLPSMEHDFMDPSIHRNIGAEYDSDDEQDNNSAEDDTEDDEDSGGMFGYQSAPDDDDENEEALPDDPFANSASFNNLANAVTAEDFSDNIQFGDDTSSIGNREESSEVRTPSPVRRTPARKVAAKRSVLYIQMELCQTGTLKELIVDGLPHRISEVWRVFRDILEALAHIHSHGVVHRDLKPTNIFIDYRGRTKIGDFGLAITGHLKTSSRRDQILIAGSEKGVGTQWYVAPELDDQGSGEYSSKADMFSLGVIFFQMCIPITTESERQSYLNHISKDPHFTMPTFFDTEGHQSQGRIVSRLIDHDQNARPSSQDLLLDPAIPENLEDATITRHLQRMINNDPQKYADLRNKLYERAYDYTQAQDLAWQNRGQKSNLVEQPDPVTSAVVNDQLREIFRRHAAVESERNFAFPVADFYSNAAEFMDDNIVLQLPFDLTLPFARMLADPDERPQYPKNYCFGTVYRRAHRGVAPTKVPEVDYDQVSYSAKDLSLKDSEVMKVLDEVLTEHSALSPRTFTIVINHGDLLDIILRFAQIDETVWDNVKRELSQLNVRRIEWKTVRDQLLSPRYEITQSSVSCLEKFNIQGDIATIKKKVNTLLDEDSAGKAVKTFARLDEILHYLDLFGVKSAVQLAPLSNNTEQLYRGSVMFKAIENKSRKILAVGGRYDRLIETLSFNIPKGSVRAVGFRINVSVLNAYVMAEEKKRLTGKQSAKDANTVPSRMDVVVTSFDETVLRSSCLEIYRNLLACGIKVELSEHYNNMAELDKYYGDLNYLLVIVRSGSRIKVRNYSKDEVDVRPGELVTHVKNELGERNSSLPVEPKLRRMTSSHTGEKAIQRVSVCAPSHKDKKANRAAIVDAAAAAAHEMAEEMGSNAPIVAISTKDEVLELIRNTRLADDASWRSVRQGVAAGERQYLVTVQELLQEKAEEGAKGAFVVNYRTNTCFFYDFGKKV